MKYICDICQKVFSQKGHLDAHKQRKRPCKKNNTIEVLIEHKVQEFLEEKVLSQHTVVDLHKNVVVTPVVPPMDISTKTREELIVLCKERRIKGYTGKKKADIAALLSAISITPPHVEKIVRLNYIGSKFQLLDWLSSILLEKTGYPNFTGKTVADLFAGTGIVSHFFRTHCATVLSNDAELYSSIITHAFTRSTYTPKCKEILEQLQQELVTNQHSTTLGYITCYYSPWSGCKRMFFTVENARRIDYLRKRIETLKPTITADEYTFLLASLLSSADAVSNVPAVYGCFLKNFKAKATRALTLTPLHTLQTPCAVDSRTTRFDVLNVDFLATIRADIVYLDPPYNERQYSKNYFPLNMIAKTPVALETEPELKGKTGIPQDCFLSPFCKKGEVEAAFESLLGGLRDARWIFLSYNSESLVSKEKMLEILKKYGTATVVERDYKRFKSFDYNKDTEIKEYLFCLERRCCVNNVTMPSIT